MLNQETIIATVTIINTVHLTEIDIVRLCVTIVPYQLVRYYQVLYFQSTHILAPIRNRKAQKELLLSTVAGTSFRHTIHGVMVSMSLRE